MTSTCIDACVVCDIDGFTGRNDLTIQGQIFPEFCTTIFHNMSYIAFVAGTEDLTIEVSVTNCSINFGVEIGIFESLDCQTFTPVTACNTDVPPNGTARFSNTTPLVVGQHYYLILDGSRGDICDWTFNVISGSTLIGDLTTSGPIAGPQDWCTATTTYSAMVQPGATFYAWTIDGVQQAERSAEIEISFPADGTYEVCVTASNVCDEAPPTCIPVNIETPSSFLQETVCVDECVEINGALFCETGLHQISIPLSNGCDSIVRLDLTILPPLETNIDLRLCQGSSFEVGNSSFSTSGTHEATIQNALGCDSIVRLNLTILDCELSASISSTIPTCYGDQDGQISVALQTGVPPFTYEWKNILNTTIAGTGTSVTLTNIDLQGLPAGIYEILITDDMGDQTVFIQELNTPPLLFIDTEVTDYNGYQTSCHESEDGEINASGNGGIPPYQFSWSNGQTDEVIVNLSEGTYNIQIIDQNGCIKNESITLTSPEQLDIAANFIDPNCAGENTGAVELIAQTGGTPPFSHLLNGTLLTSSTIENLTGGDYTLITTDANGCTTDTSQTLTTPDIPKVFLEESYEIKLGEEVRIAALTNNSYLTDIRWNNPSNALSCDTCLTTIAAPVNDTEFILTVTSIDNCIDSATLFIQVNKIRDIHVPTAFSPNGDGNNDMLSVFASEAVNQILNFTVFDRWGNLIYNGFNLLPNDVNTGWNGYFRGKEIGNGVYVWMAEVEYLDGEIITMKGDVTVLK